MEAVQLIVLTEWQLSLLEWLVVAFNLLFIILLVFEHISCWIFGIIGSLLGVFLFLRPEVKLYSEAILYAVYAGLGVYGWIIWRSKQHTNPAIISWQIRPHLWSMGIGLTLWAVTGILMSTYTEAAMPWADAFTTSFSFVATWLEAKKVLQGWIYWIVLNLASIVLYGFRDLNAMAGMMAVYAILSVVGYMRWKKVYLVQGVKIGRRNYNHRAHREGTEDTENL